MQDSNWKRVSKDEYCPICGKPDWCTVTKDDMIACCMRVEADKQADNGGWIHHLSETPTPFVISYAPPNNPHTKSEPSVLDKVYSAMLSRLTLSETHKQELLSPRRGMTTKQIKTNEYKSLPLQGRAQIAKDLVQLFGPEPMTDVPGFYLNPNGHSGESGCRKPPGVGVLTTAFSGYYPSLAGAKGLLIPIRDVDQQIIACQIKVDQQLSVSPAQLLVVSTPNPNVLSKQQKERQASVNSQLPTSNGRKHPTNGNYAKYTWFSSKGKEGGTSSGAPAHVAMPSSLINSHRVWITEGALKADITSELLGETVIGVSGVGNWRSGNIILTLQQMAESAPRPDGIPSGHSRPLLDVKDVVIAYDADGEKNPHVKHHAFQLACACSAKGYNVFQAQWELHQGKGIDDLLLNGEIPTITPFSTKRRIQKLDADFMETVIPEMEASAHLREAQIALKEARQKHYNNIRALIEHHPPKHGRASAVRRESSVHSLSAFKGGLHLFTSVVGTGKTSAAMLAIKDLQQEGKWPTVKRKRKDKKTGKYSYQDEPLRLVFVTDNHAAYQQWLQDEALQEMVEIQQGRSPDEKSQWYCERYSQCHNYGAKRHNPMLDVCQECLLSHATLVGDRMMEYWRCPYLNSMDRVKAAKVVFTSKASIFNASQELKDFDVIIVDEDLLSSLWEIVSLNTDNLNDYLSGMDYIRSRNPGSDNREESAPYRPLDDFRVFINLLKEVMATPVVENNWLPAVQLMKQAAQKNNIDLQKLLDSLQQREVHYQTQRYDFEQPFSLHGQNIYPLRLMRDLISLLSQEISRPQDADTRIWLTLQGIKLYLKRQHLVEIINRGKTLINLDATPNPLLQVMFPQTQCYHYNVKEHVTVTQLTNSLYTKSNIKARNYANLHKINVALEEITHNATMPVIFCHKAFDPQVNQDNPLERAVAVSPATWVECPKDVSKPSQASVSSLPRLNVFSVSNPSARYGHFDYETRAQNGYSNADVLCIVGHYSKPISHLRALAQAVRHSETGVSQTQMTIVKVDKNNPMDESSVNGIYNAHLRPLPEILRPYWHRKTDGSGLGRWCKADPDPLVQELILQSEAASYTQAIGRGRAALRSADNPLQVYLITATPIDSLPIDKLVRLSDWSKTKPNMEESAHYRPLKEKFYARRDELNAKRKQTAYHKVLTAIKQLLAQGRELTLNAIERLSGVKRTLIAELRKEIKALIEDRKPSEAPGVGELTDDSRLSSLPSEGGAGVTTVGLKISNTVQWTPPVTLEETTAGVNANTNSGVSCDNLLVPPADDKPAEPTSNEPLKAESEDTDDSRLTACSLPITYAVDFDLAAWARKKHGFTFGKIIGAYEDGFCLQEPMTIRDGVIVKDFGAFVGKKFAQLKDLDQRLPRLSGFVLEYANNLRVNCMKDLKALNLSYAPKGLNTGRQAGALSSGVAKSNLRI